VSYAQNTSVPVERSRIEIERVLAKYGATRFGSMTEADGSAVVYFEHKGRQIQLPLPMPPKNDRRFPDGIRREREQRRRWRVLLITVKAMIEAVESGIVTFDQAFLAHIVVPGTATTIGQQIVPRLDALYGGTTLKALLAENPA
jgi:hypothetical protein